MQRLVRAQAIEECGVFRRQRLTNGLIEISHVILLVRPCLRSRGWYWRFECVLQCFTGVMKTRLDRAFRNCEYRCDFLHAETVAVIEMDDGALQWRELPNRLFEIDVFGRPLMALAQVSCTTSRAVSRASADPPSTRAL